MSSYRVLVFTNLWSYEGDPSYGCFVRAKGVSAPARGWDACTPFWSRLEPRQGRNLLAHGRSHRRKAIPEGNKPAPARDPSGPRPGQISGRAPSTARQFLPQETQMSLLTGLGAGMRHFYRPSRGSTSET
jgi:hypothetical protein